MSGLPIGFVDQHEVVSGHLTFTPATIVVPLATVEQYLVSISPDGSVFTFSAATGSLAELAPGRIMLLYDVDVAKVTHIAQKSGRLVVETAPVSLADVVASGSIKLRVPPDFNSDFDTKLPGSTPAARSTAAYEEPRSSPNTRAVVLDAAPASARRLVERADGNRGPWGLDQPGVVPKRDVQRVGVPVRREVGIKGAGDRRECLLGTAQRRELQGGNRITGIDGHRQDHRATGLDGPGRVHARGPRAL